MCSRRRRGFTLLELTIAMSFVGVLIGGIALSITTCLNVWDRSRETADLNEEARAVIEVMSRDIRGAYLGLHRRGGYFLATPGVARTQLGPSLEFTTESSTVTRAALSPEAVGPASQAGPPTTDYVAVRYQLLDAKQVERPGLYRLSWASPRADWLEAAPAEEQAMAVELISEAITDLRLRYWDGGQWRDEWETTADNLRLPDAVAVELTIALTRLDDRNRPYGASEHVYQSVISVPAR
ncbi:MAG: type II secretion system protein GspJ [Armatimonadota bacterium]